MKLEFVAEFFEMDTKRIEKNGVSMRGLAVPVAEGVEAIIYEEDIEQIDSLAGVEALIDEVKNRPMSDVNKMVELVKDTETALKNIYIGVQAEEPPVEVIHKRCYGVWQYIMLADNECSVKVTRDMMKSWKKNEASLWTRARIQTAWASKFVSMQEHLAKLFPDAAEMLDQVPDVGMYVSTSDFGHHSAGIFCCPGALQSFCKERGWKAMWLMPSSIHEVIAVEADEFDPKQHQNYCNMVREITETQVDKREVLSYNAYYINPFEKEYIWTTD